MQGDLHLTPHHLKLHESLREDDQRREVFYVSKNGLNRVLSVEIRPPSTGSRRRTARTSTGGTCFAATSASSAEFATSWRPAGAARSRVGVAPREGAGVCGKAPARRALTVIYTGSFYE